MKVVQHGKYWREDLQKSIVDGTVKCPECENKFKVMKDYIPPFALCGRCGCGFMYDEEDFIEDVK